MPPLVLVAIAALSVSLPLLAWSVLARPSRDRRQMVTNLQRGLLDTAADPINRAPDPRTPTAFALSRDV